MTVPREAAPSRKAAPKDRKTPISAARKAAFDVLLAVERGQSHSDDLLRGKAVNALSLADRNLATTLVLGVLRWQIRLDHQLQALLKHPNAKLDSEVRIALRLGAFQLLHLDRIPARAAIDESVPAPVISSALFARFSSRGEADYADRLLSALRFEFGGHVEKPKEGH